MTTSKAKLFNIKRLPMDVARVVCAPLTLLFRMKRLTPTGERYTARIRGGAVIAANHTSMLDPFLVGVAVWYRRLFFLAAEAVMGGSVRAALLRGAGAIKIDRRINDLQAIKDATAVLKAGQLLAVFPQGQISQEENVETVKSGAVLIALTAGVPILPLFIRPKRAWHSRREVVFGETINPRDYVSGKFPTAGDIAVVTAVLAKEMHRLGEEEMSHV